MIGTHCPTCSQEHTANALKIHDLEQQLAASKKDHDALEFLRKHPEYQLMRSVGVLGLINGVMRAMGLPNIASKWEKKDAETGRMELVGFGPEKE